MSIRSLLAASVVVACGVAASAQAGATTAIEKSLAAMHQPTVYQHATGNRSASVLEGRNASSVNEVIERLRDPSTYRDTLSQRTKARIAALDPVPTMQDALGRMLYPASGQNDNG